MVDGVQRQLAQRFGRFVLGEHALALVHADEPLGRGAVDHRRFVAPAMRVAVGDGLGGHQAAGVFQRFQDDRHGFPDVQPAEQREVGRVGAVALHRVQDVVVGQAIGDAGVEVIHAVGGRRVHDAGAVAVAHVVGQVHRREALVTGVHVVQRVAEVQAAELVAGGRGEHRAFQAEALQAFFNQGFGQHQAAHGRFHQGVVELGVGVERLVGGDGPGGGGPDHGEGALAGGQGGQAEGAGQLGRIVGLEGHVQRVALLVGVFDLELGQRRAAVETPVNRLQAAVDKTALDHAFEGADFTGFVGEVHGAVRALPVAEHAQALEVFALLVDLLGGVGAALGLHVVAAEFAAVQFSRSRFRSAGRGNPSRGCIAHRSQPAVSTLTIMSFSTLFSAWPMCSLPLA